MYQLALHLNLFFISSDFVLIYTYIYDSHCNLIIIAVSHYNMGVWIGIFKYVMEFWDVSIRFIAACNYDDSETYIVKITTIIAIFGIKVAKIECSLGRISSITMVSCQTE